MTLALEISLSNEESADECAVVVVVVVVASWILSEEGEIGLRRCFRGMSDV